jgi:hypothetical protein
VSLGGRIVLLNLVLNSIPIFFIYPIYMKVPVKIWKRIVRIQREFLRGGVKGGCKISWIKWEVVCQPRNKGGLGV